jgi:hypothetical protein
MSELTKRDRWIIAQAFDGAQYYPSPQEWLSDVVDDVGHTVEMALAHDAPALEELTHE